MLHEMLRARGIDPVAPRSLSEVWEVFKEFVKVPSDTRGPDSDGVLYQTGTFDFYGDPEFYISFVRQFEVVDEGGEYDHYEQLDCEFRYPVHLQPEPIGAFVRWWFAQDGLQAWQEFVAMVERRPEFRALAGANPRAAKIEQKAV